MTDHYSKTCPHCHAKLIDDVWEEITIQEDESIHQEMIIRASVCSNFCGYYERID